MSKNTESNISGASFVNDIKIKSTVNPLEKYIVSETEKTLIDAFTKKYFDKQELFEKDFVQISKSSVEYLDYDPNEAWIQTYTGKRFNPTKPNIKAIDIEDIAHSLSMQCRFSGHCNKFYSVAQHSVSVSYLCDYKDRLYGLLHDASEAYLVDVPRPLKQSGKFNAYIDFEKEMQNAVWAKFGLEQVEPESVKYADNVLLSTEGRDLMSPLRDDWEQPESPLPWEIIPVSPAEAKDMFMKRYYEIIGDFEGYSYYLDNKKI